MGFRKTILNLFLYDFLLEPRTHTFLFYKAFSLSSCMFAHKQKLFNVFLKFPSSKCFAVRSAILLCTWSIDEIVLPFVENFHIFIKTWDVPALFVGYECVSELRNVTLKNSVFFFFLAELRECKSFHWCFLVEKLLFDKLDVKYKRNPDILFKFVWRRIQSNFTKMKIVFVCENLKSCAASVLPNASVLFGLLLLVQKYPVTPFQDSVLSPGATWKIRKVVFTHILQTVQTTLQSFSLNPN